MKPSGSRQKLFGGFSLRNKTNQKMAKETKKAKKAVKKKPVASEPVEAAKQSSDPFQIITPEMACGVKPK